MVVVKPISEPVRELPQLEEVVEAVLSNGGRPADAAVRINEVRCVMGRVAFLADIAVLVRCPAVGACPLHIPVREVSLAVLAVGELDLLFVDVPVLLKALEYELCVVPVLGAVGAVIAIEVNQVVIIVPLVLLPPVVDELLGGYPLLGGVDLNGSAVGVIRPAVDNVLARQFQEPDIDIRLDVLNHVAYVNRAVGVD